jgi:hypothetical protein
MTTIDKKLNKSLRKVLDIMPESFFTDDVNDWLACINYETKLKNQRILQKQEDKKLRIINGRTFQFFIQYTEKLSTGLFYDEFEIEGAHNMVMIMEQYRKTGHNSGLRCLEITLDGELIRKVNFK